MCAQGIHGQMSSEEMAAYRPDVVGSPMTGQDDGRWTQVILVTSEAGAGAGAGESTEQPCEMQAVLEELMAISTGAPDHLDLREPIQHSP